jgi:hypothetical protein
MTVNAFDAYSPSNADEMKRALAAGYVAQGVYFTKPNLQADLPAFFAACAASGFKCWLIDEITGSAAVFAGKATQGMVDGQNAARLAEKYGAPPGTSIFFAVDFAAQQSDVANIQAYFTAYKGACAPYVARMYADGLVSEAVEPNGGWYIPAATGWPGYAAAIAAGKAAIVQEPPASFFGLDADPCTVYDESVLWQPAGADPVVVPPPVVTPTANPMPDLKTMQSYLGVTADGIWGPTTAAALEKYYA